MGKAELFQKNFCKFVIQIYCNYENCYAKDCLEKYSGTSLAEMIKCLGSDICEDPRAYFI